MMSDMSNEMIMKHSVNARADLLRSPFSRRLMTSIGLAQNSTADGTNISAGTSRLYQDFRLVNVAQVYFSDWQKKRGDEETDACKFLLSSADDCRRGSLRDQICRSSTILAYSHMQ